MGLVAADWVIIVVLGGSCLMALFRGLVREALSLANWVVAALVARGASGLVSQWLSQWIDTPSIRYVIAFAVLMLVSLVIGGILIGLVVRLVRASGLGFADRVLGLMFGLRAACFWFCLVWRWCGSVCRSKRMGGGSLLRLVPIFNVGLDWILPKLLALSEGLTDSVT